MKKIKLNQEKFLLIDNDDFKRVNKFKWYCNKKGYVMTNKGVYIHRFIMNIYKNKQIDHINRNKLDNRKLNLRVANNSQNHANIGLLKNNKSGYKGISWDKFNKKWRVYITCNGIWKNLGRFNSINDAVKVYNQSALKLFNKFAFLNKI